MPVKASGIRAVARIPGPCNRPGAMNSRPNPKHTRLHCLPVRPGKFCAMMLQLRCVPCSATRAASCWCSCNVRVAWHVMFNARRPHHWQRYKRASSGLSITIAYANVADMHTGVVEGEGTRRVAPQLASSLLPCPHLLAPPPCWPLSTVAAFIIDA